MKRKKPMPDKKLAEYTEEEIQKYIRETDNRILRMVEESNRLCGLRKELTDELINRAIR